MKSKYIISVIVTSAISGIPVYYVFIYSLLNSSQPLFLQIILSLSPIIISGVLSLASSYRFAPIYGQVTHGFGTFLVSTCTFFIFVNLYYFIGVVIEMTYLGYSSGFGPEGNLYLIFFLVMFFYSPLFGLCTAFFYKLGIWIKQYQYDRNQMIRYRQ